MPKVDVLHMENPLNGEKDDSSGQSINMEDAQVCYKGEKNVVLKQDLVILPLLAISFFFAYLVSLLSHGRLLHI